MKAPRILLIGRNGQVGWELERALGPLGPLQAVDYPEVDLSVEQSVRDCVRAAAPDLILNAAAYTAVDKAEQESDLAMRINGLAPGWLAEEARATGALLVHYSTDYVFDGAAVVPYPEDHPPAPASAYGRSKLAGEQTVQAVAGRHLIFRLCWVYGTRGHNFLLTIERLAREREQLRVVSDQVGAPTWCRAIAETTVLAVQQTLRAPGDKDRHGLFHLSASGLTSWHGFAQAIVDALPAAERKCREVLPIPTADYPLPARRPTYSVLACDKLQRTFGLRLPDWRESLRLALNLAP